MRITLSLSLFLLLILSLAACAPTLRPTERFPIKNGEAWQMDGRAPNGRAVNHRVQLDSEPKQDGQYLTADIRTDSHEGVALLQNQNDLEFFAVVVIETTKPIRMSQCLFALDGRAARYEGWAFSGTSAEMTRQIADMLDANKLPDPTCTLVKQ